jgi:arylformamidase
VRIVNTINGAEGWADLRFPIDISLSTGPDGDNPNAFFINPAEFNAIRVGDFVGRVAEGGGANCEILNFCAHGNCTHTECLGHISTQRIVLPDVLKEFWFSSQLISVDISSSGRIELTDLQAIEIGNVDAIVIRSFPNGDEKKGRNWSGNNPPYFEAEALGYLREKGITHLLTDFPSVDPEVDEGKLSAHHQWWGLPQRNEQVIIEQINFDHPRLSSTITELIFVPNDVEDGFYLLNLQVPNLRTDAVPSRPILYKWNSVNDTNK